MQEIQGTQIRTLSGAWQLAPVFLPGKSHGWRSLAGDNPQGRKESDRSELLSTHVSKRLQLTGVWYFPAPGEGNGNPLQYSCLESPMNGGAWWAAVQLLPFHFSLSCIGEGNGNPLQYSCLDNPRDGGAWWAAVSWGRTESDTTEATQQQQQQLI